MSQMRNRAAQIDANDQSQQPTFWVDGTRIYSEPSASLREAKLFIMQAIREWEACSSHDMGDIFAALGEPETKALFGHLAAAVARAVGTQNRSETLARMEDITA